MDKHKMIENIKNLIAKHNKEGEAEPLIKSISIFDAHNNLLHKQKNNYQPLKIHIDNIVDYNDNIVRIKMKHIYYNKKVVDSITSVQIKNNVIKIDDKYIYLINTFERSSEILSVEYLY